MHHRLNIRRNMPSKHGMLLFARFNHLPIIYYLCASYTTDLRQSFIFQKHLLDISAIPLTFCILSYPYPRAELMLCAQYTSSRTLYLTLKL